MNKENETQKERFNRRFANRFSDLDVNDEDIYYRRANKLLDDFETYEKATGNLVSAVENNEHFMDMLTRACTQDDFDPLVWMIENCGLDLQEVVKNPEYADVIAKAHARYIEQQAQERQIDDMMKANLPKSMKEIEQFCKQENIETEQMNQCIADMWQLGEDLVKGILPLEVFQLFIKASQYDENINRAYEQGKKDGLNIKIEEHLKDVRSAPQSTIPTQTPINTDNKKKNKHKNPFVDSDWGE